MITRQRLIGETIINGHMHTVFESAHDDGPTTYTTICEDANGLLYTSMPETICPALSRTINSPWIVTGAFPDPLTPEVRAAIDRLFALLP